MPLNQTRRQQVQGPSLKSRRQSTQRRAAGAGACPPCPPPLPVFPCGNCGGCDDCCPVQVPLPFGQNCVPDNGANIQVNTMGVCVQGVDLSCAGPDISIADGCGNMATTSNIPNGEIYNTIICDQQPFFAIPGTFPQACAPNNTAGMPKASTSKRGSQRSGATDSGLSLNLGVSFDDASTQEDSSYNSTSSLSSSSSDADEEEIEANSDQEDFDEDVIPVTTPAAARKAGQARISSSILTNKQFKPNPNPKQQQQQQQRQQPLQKPQQKPAPPQRPRITVEYQTNGHEISHSDSKTNSIKHAAGCPNCPCQPTPPPNTGTPAPVVPCPCSNVAITKFIPCPCNYISTTIGNDFACDTCGVQTVDMTANDCCCCNCCDACTCGTQGGNCCDCGCDACTCTDSTTTTTACCAKSPPDFTKNGGKVRKQVGFNLKGSKSGSKAATASTAAAPKQTISQSELANIIAHVLKRDKAKRKAAKKSAAAADADSSSKQKNAARAPSIPSTIPASIPAANPTISNTSTQQPQSHSQSQITAANRSHHQSNRVHSKGRKACSCKNRAGCAACPGNCSQCQCGCVNAVLAPFGVVTNPCAVDATLTQIPPNQCGEVPCPPENPIFTMGTTVTSNIPTWTQQYWDWIGAGICGGFTSVPLRFTQAVSVPNTAPATGVTNIAINGGGDKLAIAYETGNNQIAGIAIYQLNATVWNKTQTIVPMPSPVQCGQNPCNAFTISMAFSDNGSIFVAGFPNLGPQGQVMVFKLCGCDYNLVAELQPAATAGPCPKGVLFGWAVDISGIGSRIAVGIPSCACGDCATDVTSGSVAIFRPFGCTWVQEQLITLIDSNSFSPSMTNGILSGCSPYDLFANEVCRESQAAFGRAVSFDTIGQNLAIGGNNRGFVYSALNPNVVAPGAVLQGAGTQCGANLGPFGLIATLQGTNCCNIPVQNFDQGINIKISGDASTVAMASVTGSLKFPIIPATVFIFRRNALASISSNGSLANAFIQEAALMPFYGSVRAGLPVNQMGLYLSWEGSVAIFCDPMSSANVGAIPNGSIAMYMRQINGWNFIKQVESPIPGACFGANIAVDRALSQMFVTAPNIANECGNTGRVIMFQ